MYERIKQNGLLLQLHLHRFYIITHFDSRTCSWTAPRSWKDLVSSEECHWWAAPMGANLGGAGSEEEVPGAELPASHWAQGARRVRRGLVSLCGCCDGCTHCAGSFPGCPSFPTADRQRKRWERKTKMGAKGKEGKEGERCVRKQTKKTWDCNIRSQLLSTFLWCNST